MDVPVRVVCEGCLRSVEIVPGEAGAYGPCCPYCDQPLLSRSGPPGPDELETRFQTATPESPFVEPDGPAVVDWLATWVRGTLGTLGRYQIRERLGNGGFGQVFLAHDPRLDRDVAIKVLRLPKASDRVLERFFREARAVARLEHPNIVAVYDAGFDNGQSWVAYQLVNGQPLGWHRDRQRMAPDAVARMVRDLADALDHAHHMGVVHRDIKPANILIDDLGRPRLIDFGLARRSDLDSDLTHDGAVIGTPSYMSPEQAIGMSRQADERSDVYGLGVTFHDLLYGKRSRAASDDAGGAAPRRERRWRHQADPISSSPSPVPVPPELGAICAKAMAARPDDRYASARELADALDAWLRSLEAPPIRPRRLAPFVATGLFAAALTALAFSASWAVAPVLRAARPRPSSPETIATGAVAPNDSRAVHPSVATDPDASKSAFVATAEGPSDEPTKAPDAGPSDVGPPPVSDDRSATRVFRPGPVLIGNLVSHRYHRPDCPSLLKMREEHRVELNSAEEAETGGYRACGHCHPDQSIGAGPEPAEEDDAGDAPP